MRINTTFLQNKVVGHGLLILTFFTFSILLYSNFVSVVLVNLRPTFRSPSILDLSLRSNTSLDTLEYEPNETSSKYYVNFSVDSKPSLSRSPVLSVDALINNTQLAKKPYRFDVHCQNFTKRLLQHDFFNLTALVSFPGSGNTWARHLIELASGIYTGSIYFDLDLIAKGFLGEKETWTSGTTIVQKTHESLDSRSEFEKAILLIRNPYTSIISFVQYLEVGHTASSSGHIFRKQGWEEYSLGQTYKWISLLKSWIEASIPVHIRHQEGPFHRKRQLRVVPNFPTWVREKMDNGIDFLNAILQEARNESLPLNNYAFYRNNSSNLNV